MSEYRFYILWGFVIAGIITITVIGDMVFQ